MSEGDEDVASRLGLTAAGTRQAWTARLRQRPRLFAGVGFIVFVLFVWLAFFRGDAAPEYVSELVTRGDLKVIVTATGTVEPETSVTVGSEISGRIEKVLADYNDEVKKGQVLVEIDTTSLKNALAKSDATLDESRATLLQYEATRIETAAKWKRYKSLIQTNAISQLDLDSALADLKRAEANYVGGQARVKANEAARAADETALSKAVIRSPIDGVVIERNIEPGQTVAATFETPTLFTLADDLRRMELQVNVDEADVGQVRDGQLATFTVDAYPNRLFQAKIKKLRFASTTTSNVVSYVAVLEIDNSDMTLRPGMTATAEIVTVERKNVLLVPNGATRFTPPGMAAAATPVTESGYISKSVWVLKEDEPQSVALQLGLTNGQLTEVLKGDVAEGDTVLTDVKAEGTQQ
ncbi:MAG: efflux RND transporter periplasmic adaptor subunit [Parvibaculum sp.]|nr:efflux RND transporter periplasmic adaptor subunit [Parvibaculum sp.]